MGVRRAVEKALDAPGKHQKPIFSYGPLIHNPQVLDLLQEKGISVIQEIPESGVGTVLIRAHGVPPAVKRNLKKSGFTVIDATCPRVVKVQAIIKKHARNGYACIIIGDHDHPEVIGLSGFAGKNGHVAGNLEGLKALPVFEKAIIVAQTTLNISLFADIKNWAKTHCPHYKCFHTICDSTSERQAEVRKLAESVDALIVVGGRNSGNTQRLAEVAAHSGVPTLQIENETEINTKALVSAETVGITAGASTPNWVINRVARAVERLPNDKGEFVRKFFFTVQKTMLLTNVYVAIGAGCLSYACSVLMGINDFFPHVLVSILYVLSMHTLNNLTGLRADRYNDPDRESFYLKHKFPLICLAMFCGAIGLLVSLGHGKDSFIILLVMSLMGLSYNIRLIPDKLAAGKYFRMRDIPGSKTILIAVAWGVVISILPAISQSDNLFVFSTAVAFLWVTGTVFARTAFFDLLDMHGDKIVGKETIPILLGEKKSILMLKMLLASLVVLLVVSSFFHIIPNIGFALSLCTVLMLILVSLHEKKLAPSGIRLEFLVESHFLFAGMVTVLFSVFL